MSMTGSFGSSQTSLPQRTVVWGYIHASRRQEGLIDPGCRVAVMVPRNLTVARAGAEGASLVPPEARPRGVRTEKVPWIYGAGEREPEGHRLGAGKQPPSWD